MIVTRSEPITLVGGGEVLDGALRAALALAPHVVAADGGADAALAAGVTPVAVIGDFDSISDAARSAIPQAAQHVIEEQDSTDFDKAVRSIGAPLILGVGFTGGRLDHGLAACNTLIRHPERRVILIGRNTLMLLAPPSLRLELEQDSLVSLFPMGAVEGVSDGLEWPIAGLNFAPDGKVGTSNRALGPAQGAVHLSFTAPKMLLILPVETLGEVVRALGQTVARW